MPGYYGGPEKDVSGWDVDKEKDMSEYDGGPEKDMSGWDIYKAK